MKRTINIRILDPSGNITAFVDDVIQPEYYQTIADQLFAHQELEAEQVAYRVDDSSMSMSGHEFCGNASRAFALIKAKEDGVEGPAHMTVNVSGMAEPAEVDVDTLNNYTRIQMPDPLRTMPFQAPEIPEADGQLIVDLGGIMHLVLPDVEADKELFLRIRDRLYQTYDPPAMGVMFLDCASMRMTPVVYVKDVNSIYFEGSCGSGSTALAVALSSDLPDGEYVREIHQPAGDITATLIRRSGRKDRIYIEGPVYISDIFSLEVEY